MRLEGLNFFFVFLTSIIVALPSGFFFGFPVKFLAFLGLILIYALSGFKNFRFLLSFLFLVILLLFPYLFLGVSNFGFYAFREFQMVFMPLVISVIFVSNFSNDSARYFLMLLFSSLILVFGFKLFLLLSVFFGYFDMQGVLDFHRSVFLVDFITMQIYPDLIRIFGPYDAFVAFVPLFLALMIGSCRVKINSAVVVLILVASVFVVFFSYSRYLWFVFSFGLLVLFFCLKGGLSKSFLFIAGVCGVVFMLTLGSEFISERFSERHTESSDSIRVDQFYCLFRLWLENPLSGFGLGAYSPECVRNDQEPYSYELQVFSFLPKLGLAFFVILFTYLGYVSFQFFERRVVFGLFLLLVLLTGLTNPFVFNTGFVPAYILMIFWSRQFSKLKADTNFGFKYDRSAPPKIYN